jgi:hypothetical protein
VFACTLSSLSFLQHWIYSQRIIIPPSFTSTRPLKPLSSCPWLFFIIPDLGWDSLLLMLPRAVCCIASLLSYKILCETRIRHPVSRVGFHKQAPGPPRHRDFPTFRTWRRDNLILSTISTMASRDPQMRLTTCYHPRQVPHFLLLTTIIIIKASLHPVQHT